MTFSYKNTTHIIKKEIIIITIESIEQKYSFKIKHLMKKKYIVEWKYKKSKNQKINYRTNPGLMLALFWTSFRFNHWLALWIKAPLPSSQIKYISGWGHDIHYHHPEHKTMPLINKLLDLEPPGTTYKDFLFSSQYHFGLLWKWREWNIWISSRQCIVEE